MMGDLIGQKIVCIIVDVVVGGGVKLEMVLGLK